MLAHFLLITIICKLLAFCASTKVKCDRDRCYLKYAEWVAELSSGTLNAKYLAVCLRANFVSPVHVGRNMYLLRARKEFADGLRIDINRCRRKPYVLWIEEQIPRLRMKRSLSATQWNDPLYPSMWYLTRGAENAGYDMNVLEAWKMNYSGKGVVLTIMDDGVDYTHTDLKKNYDPLASYDLIEDDPDPMPNLNNTESNKHGTRCAGQIAAEANNSVCMVGIAYNSHIGGVRMLGLHITDNLESHALSFRNDYIHIYSGSWGPEDTGKMYEGPGVLAQSAFQEGIVSGRHGLGSIYIWAAGNGGPTDSCACDGYASSIFTLSVNSVGEHNSRPSYLEQCSSTLATTYSSGGPSEKMIATIDPHQKCTTSHTGTSASAPMAAAIVALLLEANPRLSWRDVQYVTLLTANPYPFVDGNFTMNAVGRAYSSLYGYGLMDAGKMVRLGELWRGLPAHHRCTSRIGNVSLKLAGPFNHTYALNFSGCHPLPRVNGQSFTAYARNASEEGTPVHYLEHVQLYADIYYQRRGVLQITVTSPSGTETILQPPRVHDDHSGNIGLLRWPLTTVQLWGESAIGVWHIRLDNLAEGELLQSTKPDLNQLKGYWRSVWLVVYGTEDFPIRLRPPTAKRPPPPDWFAPFSKYVIHDSDWQKVYTCHTECAPGGCTGPSASQCLGGCRHFTTEFRECVPTCPLGTTPYGALRVSLTAGADRKLITPPPRARISKMSHNPVRTAHTMESEAVSSNANVVCQPCWTLCAACVRPHTEYDCTACGSGQYLVPLIVPSALRDHTIPEWSILNVALPSVAGTCLSDCPTGFYVNKATNTCSMCVEHCSVCTGPESEQCSQCKPGFRLLLGRCVDGNSVDGRCGPGQYLDRSTCTDCHSACEWSGCLPDGHCYHCKPGYPFLLLGTCVQYCPLGWFAGRVLNEPFSTSSSHDVSQLTNRLQLCEPCRPGCLSCRALDVCDRCITGLQLLNGICTNYSSFSGCNQPCASCLSTPNDCLTCGPLRPVLIPQLDPATARRIQVAPLVVVTERLSYTCGENCPQGMFPSQSNSHILCRPCPPSCLECSDESHCTSCRRLFNLDETTKSCYLGRECRQSEFFDPIQKFCTPCHSACATCIGPLESDCTSCAIHGPHPRCLHPTSSGDVFKWKKETSPLLDVQHGQCIPCCAYELVLLNRAPNDCMFCVAGRVTCLLGTEINAGEGLLIEHNLAHSDSAYVWFISEPSRLVLLFLCLILFLGAVAFITAHAIRVCRQRRASFHTMTAVRRRRHRKGRNGLADSCESSIRMTVIGRPTRTVEDALISEQLETSAFTLSPSQIVPRANSQHRATHVRHGNINANADRRVMYIPLTLASADVDDDSDDILDDVEMTNLSPDCLKKCLDEYSCRSSKHEFGVASAASRKPTAYHISAMNSETYPHSATDNHDRHHV